MMIHTMWPGRSRRLRGALPALAAAALTAAPVHPGQAAPSPRSGVAVRYDDLDLARETDRHTFEQRLDRAARALCAADRRSRAQLEPERPADTCHRAARAELDRHVERHLEFRPGREEFRPGRHGAHATGPARRGG